MKTTKVLLLGAVVAAFTFTSYAGTGAAALLRSQPASQPNVADATVITIAYVDQATPISPRAQANQSKIIKGTNDTDVAMDCRKNMVNSPKAVAECASHANMPGCVSRTLS